MEKRFYLFERGDTDYILEDPKTNLDFIEMLGDALTSEEIVDKLNELYLFKEKVDDTLNEAIRDCDNDATYETLIGVALDLGVELE